MLRSACVDLDDHPPAIPRACAVAFMALLLVGCGTRDGLRVATAVSPAEAETLYSERCASCHDTGAPRAVPRDSLRTLSVERIRASLSLGVMSEAARGLSAPQIDGLSRLLGNPAVATASAAAKCRDESRLPADAFAHPHWNGWGATAAQLRAQPPGMAHLPAQDVPRLKLKWAYGVADTVTMAAQPTVVGGRLFLGGPVVTALDAATGCERWTYKPEAGVRTAITVGRQSQHGWLVYFGDLRANVYALDAETGALVWRTSLDAHPVARVTGAPTLHDGRLYVSVSSIEEALAMNPKYPCCTFRGSVSALDAGTGGVIWKRHMIAAHPSVRKMDADTPRWGPAGASIWNSPTVDPLKRRLYVTTGNSYAEPPSEHANAIVAVELDTGVIAWARQMTANDAYTMACNTTAPGSGNCPQAKGPDVDFGASAMLIDRPNGRRLLIAAQKSSWVHALDPDQDGAIVWQTSLGRGGALGGVQWGTASDGRRVYVALSDVKLAVVPPDTPGAQKSVSGSYLRLDPDAGGGMHALDAETGAVVWRTPHPGCAAVPGCSPAQSAAVTLIPGAVFSGGLDGRLRAYDTDAGSVLWDVDTAIAYPNTVNGVHARGGSLDGPGAVVVGGVVYAVTGYAAFGGRPGNALLAFSVDGR